MIPVDFIAVSSLRIFQVIALSAYSFYHYTIFNNICQIQFAVYCYFVEIIHSFPCNIGILYTKGVVTMVMSMIWTLFILVSFLCAAWNGTMAQLGAAIPEGAQAGITLAISIAGSLCLWTGVGRLMEYAGITGALSGWLRPLMRRLFPSTRNDKELENALSANICSNLLGLGNAATPMGISAAKRLRRDDTATDELCRLVVLNTASIQLIPTSVAAVRSALGAQEPFMIITAVWITSFCSAGLGIIAACTFAHMRAGT